MAMLAQVGYTQCRETRIEADRAAENGRIYLCTNDGSADAVTFTLGRAGACLRAIAITDEDFDVISLSPTLAFNFEGFEAGEYFAFGVTYTGTLDQGAIGENVYRADLATGDFERSSNRIRFEAETPRAGTITNGEGADVEYVCLGGGSREVVGFDVRDADERAEYVYLITNTFDVVEEIEDRDYLDFADFSAERRRVYGLSYTGDLEVRVGDTIGRVTLASRCHELTPRPLRVELDIVEGGRLSTPRGDQFTMREQDPQIVNIARSATATAQLVYITIDDDKRIAQFDQSGDVDFRCLGPGKYFTYAYSYSGQLQAQLGERLWNRAVPIASACFSSSENAIVVRKRSPQDCQPTCLASGGQLAATESQAELTNGRATVMATSTRPAVLPPNYDTTYLLTRSDLDTIQGISLNTAQFTVSTAGQYRIFRLVAEFTDSASPDFLRLASIRFGETTISELESVFAQGICADLSDPATVEVIEVLQPDCTAEAGSLLAPATDVRMQTERAEVQVLPKGDATVPADFETHYLLSQDAQLTVLAISDEPRFDVASPGAYRVHTLVGETSDPDDAEYYDLDQIVVGSTTVTGILVDILGQDRCADIDFSGTTVEVYEDASCDLYAGTVDMPSVLSLEADGDVLLFASANPDARLRRSSDMRFVLTAGDERVVVATSALPVFSFDTEGTFYVHRLAGEFSDVSAADFVDLRGLLAVGDRLALAGESLRELSVCADLDPYGQAIEITPFVPQRGAGASQLSLIAKTDTGVEINVQAAGELIGGAMLVDAHGRMLGDLHVELRSKTRVAVKLPEGLLAGTYTLGIRSSRGVQAVRFVHVR